MNINNLIKIIVNCCFIGSVYAQTLIGDFKYENAIIALADFSTTESFIIASKDSLGIITLQERQYQTEEWLPPIEIYRFQENYTLYDIKISNNGEFIYLATIDYDLDSPLTENKSKIRLRILKKFNAGFSEIFSSTYLNGFLNSCESFNFDISRDGMSFIVGYASDSWLSQKEFLIYEFDGTSQSFIETYEFQTPELNDFCLDVSLSGNGEMASFSVKENFTSHKSYIFQKTQLGWEEIYRIGNLGIDSWMASFLDFNFSGDQLAFLKNGREFASAELIFYDYIDGDWTVKSESIAPAIGPSYSFFQENLHFSSDGDLIAFMTRNETTVGLDTIQLLEVYKKELENWHLETHLINIDDHGNLIKLKRFNFSEDSRKFLTVDDNNQIRVYEYKISSIKNPSIISPLHIYPNPSSSIVHLDKPGTILESNVQLTSTLGLIYNLEFQNSNQLDLTSIPSGYYIVTIIVDSTIFTTKLIKI